MTSHVPLNKLLLSPRNVRRTNAEEDIEGLADSIASKGLLQNLVVSESPTGRGIFEVDAGGRRYHALQLLVKRKVLERNWPVPVLVIPREDAREASLAENLQKIAMNPADEFEAFAQIIDGYMDGGITDRGEAIANCAKRFGVTTRRVEERLRLAALAPEILEALRQGRIPVDAAKAYAAYSDHKLQLKIYAAEQKKHPDWRHSPKAIREAMQGKVYRLDHPAVVYVGLDAYRAAGGRIERELFMGAEDQDVLLDPSIIDKLAAKRTADDAQNFAQEQGFRDGVVKSWTVPSWQDAKAPEGFKRTWGIKPENLSDEQRAEAVVPFKIAADGSTLEPLDYVFLPKGEEKPSPSYTPETPEQRAARERQDAVGLLAVRLAAPSVAGTPLEGRAFWPRRDDDYVETIVQDEESGEYVVALLVKIPASDVEAAMAEAERQYDREQAELAEEEAAEAAEGAIDVSEPAAEAVS